MVVHESFVTRKPLEFTLIVLFVILLLLLPVYFLTKQRAATRQTGPSFIPETFAETNYQFDRDSDLSESDKRTLFKITYKDNAVQWTGILLSCQPADGMFRLSIDHVGTDLADAIFITVDDCTKIEIGSGITYKMTLVDWNVGTFIGNDGKILSSSPPDYAQ